MPRVKPVEVEQIRDEPVELAGVQGDPARQVAHLVLLELQVVACHRDRHPQDPGERGPQVVRHGLQERVLHLVDGAETLRGLSFQRQVPFQLLRVLCSVMSINTPCQYFGLPSSSRMRIA